jgi:hypothetical protein
VSLTICVSDAGAVATKQPNKSLMDSKASREYNRYEDTALRLTDPRLSIEDSAGAQKRAPAGLGYGSRHRDHYLYFNSIKNHVTSRAVATTPANAAWDSWKQKTLDMLQGPPMSIPDVKALEKQKYEAPPIERDLPQLVDHRFSNKRRQHRHPGARSLGYGFTHPHAHEYLAAKTVHDVREVVNAETCHHDWGSYSTQLRDRNFLNMNV